MQLYEFKLKALYIPTNANTFIVKKIDRDFVEILIDGEYKVVPADEVRVFDDAARIISFDKFNQNLLASLIQLSISFGSVIK